LYSPHTTPTITNATGRPMITVAYCHAKMLPAARIANVSAPVATAQKIRSQALASSPAVRSRDDRLAITSAPESAEVT
jgi:hypothetical protein